MKKALKSIAKSMKVSAKCQLRNNAMHADAITYSLRSLEINMENQCLMMKQFELEHTPFISVLEGLLELVAVERITDVKSQEVVDEAKRMIRLMKPAQEKQ